LFRDHSLGHLKLINAPISTEIGLLDKQKPRPEGLSGGKNVIVEYRPV